MKRFSLNIVIFLSSLFFSISCEREKSGSIDPNYASPFLYSVNLNRDSLNLDFDTTGSVSPLGNNNYRISLYVDGKALRQFSDRAVQGMVQVFKPNAPSPFFKMTLALRTMGQDTILFEAPVSFNIQRSDIGFLRFDFSLITTLNQASNTIERTLHVTRRNSRPTLSNLIAPDTLLRPSSGFKLVLLSVATADSDGYADIRGVLLKRIFPSQTNPIDMFDDGDDQTNGDKVAGDGIFSRILRIDSTAILGDQVFLFQSSDNSGSLSDSLVHTITITE
ncbi:MAG: hypothetical protein HYR76_03010 [Ignavibacteria bacterium]|nr:hypothetical protein [Ignavibacteria bacterium]